MALEVEIEAATEAPAAAEVSAIALLAAGCAGTCSIRPWCVPKIARSPLVPENGLRL